MSDVVVIGSGVGGLFAAGRLVLDGHRPLVLERQPRLGGRFSTLEIDGYKIPTGAIAIPDSGPFAETLAMLGIDPGLRRPDPMIRVRIRGREVTAGGATWALLMKTVSKSAGRVAEGLRKGELADHEAALSIDEWVTQHTRSKTVRSLIQSIVGTTFTVNSDELPARAFFDNLRETGAFKTYGFAPHGNAAIANALGEAIEARGGEVRRGVNVSSIELDDGRVAAVHTDAGERISCRGVVSNAGPPNTARMLTGTPVAARFEDRARDMAPTAMISLSFSTDTELLPECPGMLELTDAQRLCTVGNLTALCPELAPPGRMLYEAMSVTRPGLGEDFDVDYEKRLLEEDLEATFPEFARATTVHVKVSAGMDQPAMRCLPGKDADVRTPVPNLVEAGDGVKPLGWTGTGACALAAEHAVAALSDELSRQEVTA